MERDKNNRLYIANNEGLLVFNGTNWQLYPIPNKTILRSICFGKDLKLYAGAQDEMGYFSPDENGRLRFTSIKNLLPAGDRTFSDVWEMKTTDNDVFFRTSQKIFKLTSGKFSVYPAPSNWISLHKDRNRILAQDDKTGLMLFDRNKWIPLIEKEKLPVGFIVTTITPYKGKTSLLTTAGHGIFLLSGNTLSPFQLMQKEFNASQHITSLSILQDSTFLIGTYFNGIYHISQQGKVIENIATKNGLPNNTVRFVFDDKNGNAWAGLDNGLGFFSYQNAIRHINPISFNNGAGYSALAQNGDLYFALSTGLQWLRIDSSENLSTITKQPQEIIDGLTWNISSINKQLFAGRDDGLWQVTNHRAALFSSSSGYWNAKSIPGAAGLQFVTGTYNGIEKYGLTDGSLTNIGRVENFSESSRYIESDDKNIWVSHPYRGIYKIDATTNRVTLFTKKDGLPDDLDNHVFKIKDKVLFATSAGIYLYDEVINKIIPAKEYQTLFGTRPIRYLKEDGNGNIWFVQEKMVGVADYSNANPTIHYIPELKNKILSGFENIFSYNNRNILIGGETGFYNIDYVKYLENIKPFSAYLTKVKTIGGGDTVLYGGYFFDSTRNLRKPVIPFKQNSLHFAYAASFFGQQPGLEFSYYLDGFDKDWSRWEFKPEKEYTNLPAGSYIFKLKARTSPSHESSIYEYSFTVKPPWYETFWAYSSYVLLSGIILFGILKYQSRRHRKKLKAKQLADQQRFDEEQKQIAYRHQLEIEKSEKELIRIQKEKLEGDIAHKNAELASATMNLVEKKEFILKLKAELHQLQKTAKVGDDNPELKKVLKALSEEEKLDEEWEQFSKHFNSVHGDFLTALKNKFPALKPHELRLCAYLRMNLSSKEIAPLMSISVRGVEISRYRLRKKLNLNTEDNLTQFLFDIQS